MTTEEFIHDIIPLQPAMQRMAEQILRNSDDAADAVQETLARLWHRRFRLGLVKDKRGYCLNALRNECISMLRHRRPTVDINTLADTLSDEPPQAALLAEQRYRQLDRNNSSASNTWNSTAPRKSHKSQASPPPTSTPS